MPHIDKKINKEIFGHPTRVSMRHILAAERHAGQYYRYYLRCVRLRIDFIYTDRHCTARAHSFVPAVPCLIAGISTLARTMMAYASVGMNGQRTRRMYLVVLCR